MATEPLPLVYRVGGPDNLMPSEVDSNFRQLADALAALTDEVLALKERPGGGATAFVDLTDKASADIPAINAPTSEALAGKLPTSHASAGGSAHPTAVPGGAAGFMSGGDKTKLDSMISGPPGSGATMFIDLTDKNTADIPTINTPVANALAGKLPTSHAGSGGVAHASASAGGTAGFMSGADKAKLDGLTQGATTFAGLSDAATADIPNINLPTKTALAAKLLPVPVAHADAIPLDTAGLGKVANALVAVAANRTLSAAAAPVQGGAYAVTFQQSGAGGRVIAVPSTWIKRGTETFDTAAGARARYVFRYFDGVVVYLIQPLTAAVGGGDTTNPTYLSRSLENSAPNTIVQAVSEDIGTVPMAVQITLSGAGGRTVVGVSKSGSFLLIQCSTAFVAGDAPSIAIAAGALTDLAGNPAPALPSSPVTNNLTAVLLVPGTPTSMVLGATGATTQVITSWAAPIVDSSHGPAATYQPQVRTPQGSGTFLNMGPAVGGLGPVTVSGLLSNKPYDIRLVALNAAGTGGATPPQQITTLDDSDNIVDNFNRANGPIGTASDGVPWTEITPGLVVESNKLTGGGMAVRNLGADAADVTVKIRANGGAGYPFVIIRGDGTDQNYLGVAITPTGAIQFFRMVAGAFTTIITSGGGDWSLGVEHTLRVMRTGDHYDFHIDGTEPASYPIFADEPTFAGNTYCGVCLAGGGDTLEDLSVYDTLGGGGGTVPLPVPGATMIQGMNLGSVFYFDAEPVYVDLIKQSGVAYNLAGTALAVLDENGWPDEDFIFGPTQRLPPDAPLSQPITMLVDGNPGSVTMPLANYWTLGAVTYNAGTDTATIQLTSPDRRDMNMEGLRLRFSGSKKTPASAAGSGIRRIRMPRPGYEATPDQLVTNEFLTHCEPFQILRFLKPQRIEVDATVTSWANAPRRSTAGMFGDDPFTQMPIEDIVEACNAAHCNLWVNVYGMAIGELGSESYDYGLAQYVEANLDPELYAIYEYNNETWNFGYQWFAVGVNKVMYEINGFWNDNFNRGERNLVSATRAGGLVTLTLNVPHLWTTGQVFSGYVAGLSGGTGNFTGPVTVVSPTSATIVDAGPDGPLTLTAAGGGIQGISVLTYDGATYPSQTLAERWFDRRRVQMSDNIRAAVGDAKLFNRHRPVYMSQMGPGTEHRFADAQALFDVLGVTFKQKFSALGGGGYNYGGNPDTGTRITVDYLNPHTRAEYLAAYLQWAQDDIIAYHNLDGFKALALMKGVAFYGYEFGTDTKMYQFGSMPYYGANAYELRQATLDPGWTAVEQIWCDRQSQFGADIGMQFNMEMIRKEIADGMGYWAMTYSPTEISPKQQGFINYAANPPAYTRNIAPGTMDARQLIGRHGDLSATGYPMMGNPSSVYLMPADRMIWLVNGSETRSMSLVFGYKIVTAGVAHEVTVVLNDNQVIGTLNIPAGAVDALGTIGPITVPIKAGSQNAIQLVRDAANYDFEIRSLTFS